jgi:Ca2+-binding EF-hand superfamily protein
MNTKRTLIMLSAVATLAGASLASAQPNGGAKRFEKLDANGDGVVTLQEMEAGALARFAKADANKDGKVTAEERRAAFEAHKRERFAKRDANGNGLLERSEVERMPEKWFAKLDANGDGALSQDELRNMPHKGRGKHFKGARGGEGAGDRTITKAEVSAKVKERFQKLDKNGDGRLTQDELKRGKGTWGKRAGKEHA